MSRDPRRAFGMQQRDRDRDRPVWGRSDLRRRSPTRKRSRSRSPPMRSVPDGGRPRSPRRNDKDMLDENILSEISKLPEPSELWDSQHQDPNYVSGPPPGFQAEAPNPSYPNYQTSYSGIYDDFPSVSAVPQAQIPPEIASWNQMSLPPPPGPPAQVFVNNIEDQIKKEAAIESEMRHQKAALSKQREDYKKKAGILKKELDTLKDQRNELRGDAKRSPSPDTKRFLKENTKLQLEIQNKLKTINNVVDMLNGIIGEDAPDAPDSDDSDRTTTKRKSRSPSGKKSNYVYYDPEMHWCRVCNEFPPTAKDYLNHLHSPAHHKMAAAHMEAPWHSVTGVNEGFPSYPSAPTKRTPIRGLQFFVPSTAWYCKLCDQFIGDLHCASAHLKSQMHSKNYTNFVEQNPHWETDWMSDRQKAFEKAQAAAAGKDKPAQYAAHTITFHKDGFHTKRKEPSPPPGAPDKKRKKERKKKSKRKRSSSSSSSSHSSSSDSEVEKKKKKKNKKEKEKFESDEKSLTDWMSAIQTERLNDNDRQLLDTIKSRLKIEKDNSKRRSAERSTDRAPRERERSADRKARESERREQSSRERRCSRERARAARPRDARAERRRSPPPEPKKPEIKKMPFIGKMPVYKHLNVKPKTEEQKKEEQKKKEEDQASKKRREEMDAEIQKKVAEFKEKIARAQLERQPAAPPALPLAASPQLELPPPGLALPQQLAPQHPQHPPPGYLPQPTPPPAQPPQPTLPKDFQEALDIIFPSDVKPELTQDGLLGFPPGLPPGFPVTLGVPPFSLPGLMPQMPPQMPQQMPPQMFGFDMFPPRPQLYDAHVPLVPSPKPRARVKHDHKQKAQAKPQPKPAPPEQNHAREQMDDLAMLGIDATDVGANC